MESLDIHRPIGSPRHPRRVAEQEIEMPTDDWEKGFDAFMASNGDDDAWVDALHHECDDWFWGFLDAQDYCRGGHQGKSHD